ncbi:MAG: ABC transporter ATP-binding protein [Betaproteobacteria bacterium]|nr:ABC transporter ATP-binding protein [Betaproteobacteria bacterium]
MSAASRRELLQVADLRTRLHTGDAVVRAVDGLTFSIGRGETFALLGESGCGKSMTALSVMRLLPEAGQVAGGTVRLDGTDLLALPEVAMRGVRGRRVAMIFQEPGTSLNPVLTVGEQIMEVLDRHTPLRGDAARRRVIELLEQVGIPDPVRRVGEYPFHLSGGMKQRVMIATALAGEPDLLIADEPTTALDVTIQAQVLELIRSLQARTGMAILLITHDLGVVSEMAHRVAVMYAGEIVETASRERFFSSPAHPYSRKLFDSLPRQGKRGANLAVIRGAVPPLTREFGGCRFADRCDFAWDLCRGTVPPAVALEDGQTVRCHLYSEPRAESGGRRDQSRDEGEARRAEGPASGQRSAVSGQASAPSLAGSEAQLLKVAELKVHFPIHRGLFKRVVGQVMAVDGVSLGLAPGRTLALVGESGCGKTTVAKGILRLIPPTAGSVRFAGVDLAGLAPAELRVRRAEFQIIFQDPYASLNPRMRVVEIIEEGMTALGVGGSGTGRWQEVDRLLGQVGLPPEAKFRYPHEFSGGQRQRIAIARALAVNPKLLICDEPTSALDVSVQAQILNLLKELQERLGLAFLFITHNISVVEYLAHEVAVMYLGRIVEHGPVEEVLNRPKHPYTRALLSAVPVIDRETKREVIRLQGDLPSPANPPAGCHFHPRCPQAMTECREHYPGVTQLAPGQEVRCFLYGSGETTAS